MPDLPEALDTLYQAPGPAGPALPLPPRLAAVYGALAFPQPARDYVIANFVETLDGVVSFNLPGHSGGGEISGFNAHDRLVMGILRAAADAVLVGAGTMRAALARHLWTADYIFPPLADEYQALRQALGKPPMPLNVFITASGELDLRRRRVFAAGEVPVLVITTPAGAEHLSRLAVPPAVHVTALPPDRTGQLDPAAIFAAIAKHLPGRQRLILSEAGPRLTSQLLAHGCLDELFLTLAPQVAGRDASPSGATRPSFVAGHLFALGTPPGAGPGAGLWTRLLTVRRGGSHLFLRYGITEESTKDTKSTKE